MYICNMITKEDVEKFLENFFIKVKVFGIRFRNDRSKNYESLKELGITAQTRLSVVMDLKWEDYSAGPITDELNKR